MHRCQQAIPLFVAADQLTTTQPLDYQSRHFVVVMFQPMVTRASLVFPEYGEMHVLRCISPYSIPVHVVHPISPRVTMYTLMSVIGASSYNLMIYSSPCNTVQSSACVGIPEVDNASWQYDRDLFQQQGLTSGLLFEDDAQLAFDEQYMDEDLDMDSGDYDYIEDLEDPSDYDVREVSQGTAVGRLRVPSLTSFTLLLAA